MEEKQFFGKTVWRALGIMALAHIVAVLVFDTGFETIVLVIAAALTAFVTYKSLPTGLLIAFGEVFIGGHGHLFSLEIGGFTLSLRIAVFAAVLGVWAWKWLRGEIKISLMGWREAPWLALLIAVIIGTSVGFATNDPSSVFDDANGYIAIAYLLPILSIEWNQLLRRELLHVLTASVLWMCAATLMLSFIFTHFPGTSLDFAYTFVRDQRLFEITLLADNYFYRIFSPSQWFAVFLGLIALSASFFAWQKNRLPDAVGGIFVACVSVLMLGLSRSFAVGLVVGAVILALAWLIFEKEKRFFAKVLRTFKIIILTMIAFVTVVASIWLPFPSRPTIENARFYETSAEVGRDVAVSARMDLLEPLLDAAVSSPVLGSGFGARIGTEYRFEWGYLDLWLKTGIFGLFAFGLLYIVLIRGMMLHIRHHGNRWLMYGFAAGTTALYIVHFFTPFLNHPIGIMTLLFVIPFIDFERLQRVPNYTTEKSVSRSPLMKSAAATRGLPSS